MEDFSVFQLMAMKVGKRRKQTVEDNLSKPQLQAPYVKSIFNLMKNRKLRISTIPELGKCQVHYNEQENELSQ